MCICLPLKQAAEHSLLAPEQTISLSFLFRCFLEAVRLHSRPSRAQPQQLLNPHLRASVLRLWLEPTAEAVAISGGAYVSASLQKGWPWRLVGQPLGRRASSSTPYTSLVLICFKRPWSRLHSKVRSSSSVHVAPVCFSAFQLS